MHDHRRARRQLQQSVAPGRHQARGDRRGARSSGSAAHGRRRAQAGARIALWPPAAGRDRHRAGADARACCCSTSRRRACRPRKAISFSTSLPASIPTSPSSSSSTTWTWCCASPRRSPCWCRRGAHARHARGDHGQRRSARGLSRPGRAQGCAMVERALELDKVSAGYGETVVLEDVALYARGRRDAVDHRPQRRRQDRRCSRPSWATPRCMAARSVCTATISRTLATYRRVAAGLGLVPQEREIFPSLTLHGKS